MRPAGMVAPAPERYDVTQGQFRFDEAEIEANIEEMLLDHLNDDTTPKDCLIFCIINKIKMSCVL